MTQTLQEVEQTVIDGATCRRHFPNFGSNELCTSSARGGTCHGDSGGPLVLENSGPPKLVGIVSYGLAVCGAFFYNYFFFQTFFFSSYSTRTFIYSFCRKWWPRCERKRMALCPLDSKYNAGGRLHST